MNLLEKAKQYANGASVLKEWLGDGAQPVPHNLAQERADTCLKCPKHSTHWSFVESIADAIRTQIELKNHLQLRVGGEDRLHVCSVCGCAVRLKVHVPIEQIALDADERDQYWDQCWLRKES